ncbi:MAG: nucleotidyl transferase AbiEii/AbiGii toxin family protein [Thermoguttaceae bacterium]|nr:nucleotidyl transferase AbiEii/AbiGii toxin family protein [Thermoguttaceae bacterium]
MSLKARIRNYAKKSGLTAQVVLQNFMFERFLARLSRSEYKDKFVIKGGILIAAIVGLDVRSTMDIDTTLRGLPLEEQKVRSAIESIGKVALDDNVAFRVVSIEPIRKDDHYGGYRVRIDAVYDTIATTLSIDVTAGDVITPGAVRYEFNGILDETEHISLWGYNIETVMAEKAETILRRGVFNTRPRDYYDIYILGTTQNYSRKVFRNALAATAAHRRTTELIADPVTIVSNISNSGDLQEMWTKYQNRFPYARTIQYADVITVLKSLLGLQ